MKLLFMNFLRGGVAPLKRQALAGAMLLLARVLVNVRDSCKLTPAHSVDKAARQAETMIRSARAQSLGVTRRPSRLWSPESPANLFSGESYALSRSHTC